MVKFLMILMLFSTIPKDLPDHSWMAGMVGTNIQLVIVSLVIDVIMIVVHISSKAKADSKGPANDKPTKRVWIMDTILLILLLLVFLIAMTISLLSVPMF